MPIAADDDAGSLHDKLADLGAHEIVGVLAEVGLGRVRAVPQDDAGVTYAAKIEKREAWLDWTRPAAELERAVRAFRPSPGAVTRLAGAPLKVWRARVARGQGMPGTLIEVAGALLVACGEHALAIEEVQRPGGRRTGSREFLRGHALQPGTRLG